MKRLALILNMAITELVLLISKVLEAARAIRNKILHTDVTNAEKTDFPSNIEVDNTDNTSAIEESTKVENEITTQEESFKEDNVTEPDKTVIPQKIPDKLVMTPEPAAYPKLKKIKAELDNQNKWTDQLVLYAMLHKPYLKNGRFVRTAIRTEAFCEFLSVVSLNAFNRTRKKPDKMLQKQCGRIGAVFLKSFNKTPSGILINSSVLIKMLSSGFIDKTDRRNEFYVNLDTLTGIRHLFVRM